MFCMRPWGEYLGPSGRGGFRWIYSHGRTASTPAPNTIVSLLMQRTLHLPNETVQSVIPVVSDPVMVNATLFDGAKSERTRNKLCMFRATPIFRHSSGIIQSLAFRPNARLRPVSCYIPKKM